MSSVDFRSLQINFLKKRFVGYKNEDFVQLNNMVGFFHNQEKRQLQILKKIISFALKYFPIFKILEPC